MEALVFREEEKPKFNFRTAFLMSLLLLLLLFFIVRQTKPFSLSEAEMLALAERKEELERELTFRFLDAPSNVDENEDPEFFSDADRVKASQQQAELEPENNDPISRGDTYELENAPMPAPIQQPTPPSPAIQQPDQQAQPEVAEASQSEPQEDPNEIQEEPEEVQPQEVEAPEPSMFEPSQGNIPLDPGAPKPFRPLSKADREVAKQRAAAELRRMEAQPQAATPPGGGRRFDNPAGSPNERLGFSIDTGQHQLGPYLEVLRQLVKANWRVPTIARFEVSGVAVVSFNLHKDGMITDATITRSAEIEPLDTSSLNAIINVYKAPPLPQHIKEDKIPIRFAFYYNVRPRY
jgi:colicin import membrane protein